MGELRRRIAIRHKNRGALNMQGTFIKYLGIILCVAALASCGGGSSPAGSQSPADRLTGGDGGGSGSDGGDSTGGGDDIIKIGSGTGASFAQGALAATDTDLQAGASTDIVVNLVDGDNVAISDPISVTFTSDCYANALASFDQTAVQTIAGRASVTYSAAGCSGEDVVTAMADVDGTILQASVELSIAPDEVLAVNFVSAEPGQLALRGMGGEENGEVRFKLVGAQGAPIPGELITFSLSTTAGGVSLAPNTDGDPIRETKITNNSGEASVVVQSGTVATNVRVIATHNATGIQGTSEDLVVSTGVPVFDKFSVSYGPQAPAGAVSTDGIEVEVSVIASDQFGNDAFDGTRISFWSPESGNIDSSCVLASGRCTVTWISSDPRPIDGRATIIAYTNGAEDFVDTNGNNVFDDGEVWLDLPEAYADANENGTHDSGEFFVDVTDANPVRGTVGVWDSEGQLPEVWDGPCLSDFCPGRPSATIWRGRVITISIPYATLFEFSGPIDPDTCPQREQVDPTPAQLATDENPQEIINLTGGAVTLTNLYVADGRPRELLPCHIMGNSMPSGTTIEFTTDNGEIVGTASWEIPDGVGYATPLGAIQIQPDDEPSNGTLTLTVTPPTESAASPTIFTWQVID